MTGRRKRERKQQKACVGVYYSEVIEKQLKEMGVLGVESFKWIMIFFYGWLSSKKATTNQKQ